MRDLSFFLRLHAFLPLARFSTTHRKPYLPLEVRYLIRPMGEVFLYLSNNPDNKTWCDDLSLFGTTEKIARFIPATGNIPLLLEFLPMPPEGGFSCLTNHYAFLGMLCRRGLACHYLASCDRNLSSFTFRGEEKREEEKSSHLHFGWFLLSSAALSALLVFGAFKDTALNLTLLISWLVGTFIIFTIFIPLIGDENIGFNMDD